MRVQWNLCVCRFDRIQSQIERIFQEQKNQNSQTELHLLSQNEYHSSREESNKSAWLAGDYLWEPNPSIHQITIQLYQITSIIHSVSALHLRFPCRFTRNACCSCAVSCICWFNLRKKFPDKHFPIEWESKDSLFKATRPSLLEALKTHTEWRKKSINFFTSACETNRINCYHRIIHRA